MLRRGGVINHHVIKKLRRDQHHRKRLAHRLFKSIKLRIVNLIDTVKVINLIFSNRSPKRPRHEAFDNLVGILASLCVTQR